MPDTHPRLYGVLTTFKRPVDLERSLQFLGGQRRVLDRLIVVDNDPLPENQVALRSYCALGLAAEYLPMKENLGPAGGIALAMKRILTRANDRDWVVLFDDDEPPTSPLILSTLIESADAMRPREPRLGGVGLVGARIDWRRGRLQKVSKGPVDYLWSNTYPLYSVGALRQAADYPREMFFGFEELEFGLRLSEAGFALHVVNPTSLRLSAAHDRRRQYPFLVGPLDWRRYYSLRNFIYMLRSHGHPVVAARISLIRGIGKPLANLLLRPGLALRHLRMNALAIRDGWLGRLGRTVDPDGGRRRDGRVPVFSGVSTRSVTERG